MLEVWHNEAAQALIQRCTLHTHAFNKQDENDQRMAFQQMDQMSNQLSGDPKSVFQYTQTAMF